MMKRIPSCVAAGVVVSSLLVPALARAQQHGPHKHDLSKLPRIDLDEQVPTEGGKTASRREILSHIDPHQQVELHGGVKVTVAELFGHLREIEDRHGKPLSTIAAQAHVHPASAQALQTQKQVHTDHLAQLRRAQESQWKDLIHRRRARSSEMGAGPGASGPQTLHTGWQKEFGHEDTLAAYGSFSVAVEAPKDQSAVCLASLDFGGYLLKHHQSLAKVSFHEEALAGSATGNVGVYVLGNAAAVWHRDFRVGKEQAPRYSHTWMTPELAHEIGPFWGVIYFQIKAKGSATFDLSASNELDPKRESIGCAADFKPSASAKAIVDVGVKVGVPKLSSLIRVGVKGDVTIARITTPAAAGMRVEQKPQMSLNEHVKASVNASFLNGKMMFEVDLANPCIKIPLLGKHCLLSLFHLKSHYEFMFHDWNGFEYDNVLLDVTRSQALAGPTPPSPSPSSSSPSSASSSSPSSSPPSSSPPLPAPAAEMGGGAPSCQFDSSKGYRIRACDDYVSEAARCAARAGADGARLRAETSAQRARFESMTCESDGPAKLPAVCEEAMRFLKRSCP
jgi:hypothetical protein